MNIFFSNLLIFVYIISAIFVKLYKNVKLSWFAIAANKITKTFKNNYIFPPHEI